MPNEGAEGETVLMIEIPDDQLADYDLKQEGLRYREFCVPAQLANQYGPPVIVNENDVDDDRWQFFAGLATASKRRPRIIRLPVRGQVSRLRLNTCERG